MTQRNRHDHTRIRRGAHQRGFTLVEVIVSAAVLGIAILSGSWAMSLSVSAQATYEGDGIDPALLAKEVHALATTLDKTPSGTVGVTSGEAVQALDSLEGAVFSPPIRADGTSWTAYSGWTQSTDLDVFDVSDLSSPSGASPLDGLSEDGTQVYRLSVTISQGGEQLDTFHWWISP